MPPPNRNRKMTEHEPIGKWMRRIMQPGETLAPRHDMRMCVVVSSDVIDLIDALEAKLETAEQYESSLACLADCINQELREASQFSLQINDPIGEDMRPFIRRLVDANRKRAAAQQEEKQE